MIIGWNWLGWRGDLWCVYVLSWLVLLTLNQLFWRIQHSILRHWFFFKISALYKSFTYLLTYFITHLLLGWILKTTNQNYAHFSMLSAYLVWQFAKPDSSFLTLSSLGWPWSWSAVLYVPHSVGIPIADCANCFGENTISYCLCMGETSYDRMVGSGFEKHLTKLVVKFANVSKVILFEGHIT